jgi:hypothetical protein
MIGSTIGGDGPGGTGDGSGGVGEGVGSGGTGSCGNGSVGGGSGHWSGGVGMGGVGSGKCEFVFNIFSPLALAFVLPAETLPFILELVFVAVSHTASSAAA